jgi:hypothetical protein
MLDKDTLEQIRVIRDQIRAEEGGGGMCHYVAETLAARLGWEDISGVYTSLQGEVICEAHHWNRMPDGTIVDATADQFGEGHDVRLVLPGDDDYPRYRLEWYQDWNPVETPDLSPSALGYSLWTGELDADQAQRLKEQRGPSWWLGCLNALSTYLSQQEMYQRAATERVAHKRSAPAM